MQQVPPYGQQVVPGGALGNCLIGQPVGLGGVGVGSVPLIKSKLAIEPLCLSEI